MDFDLSNLFGGPLGMSLFGGPGGPILGGKPPGAGPLFGDMSVPGMPAMKPGGGLLKAGDEDMQPPGMAPAPGMGGGMLKAGLERGPAPFNQPGNVSPELYKTPVMPGQPGGATPEIPGLLDPDQPAPGAANAAAAVPGNVSGFVIPSTSEVVTPGMGPDAANAAKPAGLATPAGAGRVPADQGDRAGFTAAPAVARPVADPDRTLRPPAGAAQPVAPAIDITKPTAGGQTIGSQGAPPVAGTTTPDVTTTGTPGAGPGSTAPGAAATPPSDAMGKFREWLSKTGNISGKQEPAPAGRSPGSAGAPHRPTGGAQLMQQLLEAHAKAMPHPQAARLPEGLLRRFRGA